MKIELLYLGQRLEYNKIQHAFKDRKGDIHHWTGVKGLYPGTSYYCEKKDGQMLLKKCPESLDDEKRKLHMTDEERIELEKQKVMILEFRQQQKKQIHLRQPHKDIVTAINLLKKFCRKSSKHELRLFLGYIENELSKRRK